MSRLFSSVRAPVFIGLGGLLVILACAGPQARLKVGKVPGGEIVEAEGLAPYVPEDLPGTKTKSLAEAQRSAVEKVVGVYLSAGTRVEQAVSVEQHILANTAGYLQKYDVLEEGRQGNFWRTKIRALVLFDKIGEDLKGLGLMSGPPQGNPRLAVLVEESVEDKPKDSQEAASGITQTLLEQGFTVVDRSTLAGAVMENAIKSVESGDYKALSNLASQIHSEILVVGQAQAHPIKDVSLGGFVSYRSRVSLQAIQSGTDKILAQASEEASGLDPTATVAASKALESAGRLAAQKLGVSVRQALSAPVQIDVGVKGLSGVDALKVLQEDLRSLKGVQSLQLRHFSGGEASLTVWVDGVKGEELAASWVRKNPAMELRRVEPYQIELEVHTP